MRFSRVREAERGADAFALPPALPLPRARSQPRLSPNVETGQPEETVPLPGCSGLRMRRTAGPGCFQGGAAIFAYSQRKRGNLGTKVAELRHSLALLGDTSLGTVSQRGRGSHCLCLQSPFSKHTGLQGWFVDGAGVGVTGLGGCWSKCCSGGEGVPGRAETRREDVSQGEGSILLLACSPAGCNGSGESDGDSWHRHPLGVKTGPQKQPGWALRDGNPGWC